MDVRSGTLGSNTVSLVGIISEMVCNSQATSVKMLLGFKLPDSLFRGPSFRS